MSYDNTRRWAPRRGGTWRSSSGRCASRAARRTAFSWLMLSDVCKHCQRAGCLEDCPTGAIIRTEFDSVYVQPDVCNGCGYCVVGCPFGVIDRREDDGRAWKCTLCYDRLKGELEPACAKACPTDSIQFGELDELRRAEQRVATLHERGWGRPTSTAPTRRTSPARRPERVLPAGRPARGLQPAARPRGSVEEGPVGVVVDGRGRAGDGGGRGGCGAVGPGRRPMSGSETGISASGGTSIPSVACSSGRVPCSG